MILQPKLLKQLHHSVPSHQPIRSHTRRTTLRCNARGGSPYEPLEKAVQAINRVISIGEKARWASGTDTDSDEADKDSTASPKPERWVQFGAVTTSSLTITPPDESAVIPSDKNIQAYLSLSVDEYSLLDPKWITKDPESGDDVFRFCLPLSDIIGVDLQPELTIKAHPDPTSGQVTLVGDRAALGSPDIDAAFKLNMVAAISPYKPKTLSSFIDPRNIPRPSHIPGRPVSRLKQWAANRRRDNNNSAVTVAQEAVDILNVSEEDCDEEVVVGAVPVSSIVPIPDQKVYMSGDEEDSPSSTNSITTEQLENTVNPSKTNNNRLDSEQVHCRVKVTMAVRVPGPLKLVPNALLGYAASLVLKAVLQSTTPNFLNLLVMDYEQWRGGIRNKNTPAGSLYPASDGELPERNTTFDKKK